MSKVSYPRFQRQSARHAAGIKPDTSNAAKTSCSSGACGQVSQQQGYTLQFCPDCIWAGLIGVGVSLVLGAPFGMIAAFAYLFREKLSKLMKGNGNG